MSVLSLWDALAEIAEKRSDSPALQWGDESTSYGDLHRRARASAGALHDLGARKGDRVAVALPNSPSLIDAFLGTLCLGAVYVPLNPGFTAAEVSYIVNHVDALVLLADTSLSEALSGPQPKVAARVVDSLPRAEPILPVSSSDAGDAAMIVYTSGTTGRPKGAVLSHRALLTNLRAVARAWEWTASDRLLLTLPCSHLHGIALGLLGSFLVGSSVVLRPRFSAEEVPLEIERRHCTMFFGVPTMYGRLVRLSTEDLRRHDLRSMRLWACGSAPLLPTTFERFREVYGVTLLERYGMSEGGFMLAAPYRGPRVAGVVGLPIDGVEVRIVDDEEADRGILRDVDDGVSGELIVRGSNLFSGYWNDPQSTRAAFVDGWFRTGDLAVRDANGQIRIAGRRSADIIKTRGYKVSAVEIEDTLQSCAGVREVAVVGVPHTDWGQEIVAVVAKDADAPSAEQLIETCRGFLASYKVPSRVVFVDEIPKVGPGKFRKAELTRQLGSS